MTRFKGNSIQMAYRGDVYHQFVEAYLKAHPEEIRKRSMQKVWKLWKNVRTKRGFNAEKAENFIREWQDKEARLKANTTRQNTWNGFVERTVQKEEVADETISEDQLKVKESAESVNSTKTLGIPKPVSLSILNAPSIDKLLDHPIQMSGFCDTWPCRQWTFDHLADMLDGQHYSCRIAPKSCKPCMETDCCFESVTVQQFILWLRDSATEDNPLFKYPREKFSCYIDYKYMHEMFSNNREVFNQVRWEDFGVSGFDGSHSTIWLGSEGASTPGHQDSYGFNLVTQLVGRKLWVLFPPEDSVYLWPTRLPYEESSVFTQVNLRRPDLKTHGDVQKAHPVMIILSPGETLYVPHHWWHYVTCLEPSISINVWIPLASDVEQRVHEAVTRVCASSLIKDVGSKSSSLLNPQEVLETGAHNILLLKAAFLGLPQQNVDNTDKATSEISHQTDTSKEKTSLNTSSDQDQFSLFRQFIKRNLNNTDINMCGSCSIQSNIQGKRRHINKVEINISNKRSKTNISQQNTDNNKGYLESVKKLYHMDSCKFEIYENFMVDLCKTSLCPNCEDHNSTGKSLHLDGNRKSDISQQNVDDLSNSSPCLTNSGLENKGNLETHIYDMTNSKRDVDTGNDLHKGIDECAAERSGSVKLESILNTGDLSSKDIAECLVSSVLDPCIISHIVDRFKNRCKEKLLKERIQKNIHYRESGEI